MIRVGTNLRLKERKTYTFDNFKGVDFSTSPYKVAANRATKSQNLIYKDGTVRKRNGWRSLCKLPDKINGLFSFEIEGERFTLAYAGNRFYLLAWNGQFSRYDSTDITTSGIIISTADVTRLISRRIQLYVNKNKAYIVGAGDYLVFGKWANGAFELRRVLDNEDVFVPTTTVNIDVDGVDDTNRGTFQDVNILSTYRKNTFLGVDAASGTWTVDTKAINVNSDVSIILNTYGADETTLTSIDINNRLADKTNLYAAGDDATVVGTIAYDTGKITLNINTKPQEENTSNITVLFAFNTEGQENIVANATLSAVFGGDGNSDRLIISGADANKNVYYWSGIYDFTYFADTHFSKLGSDSSAIVGFARVSDATLLVFKERNGSDSTAYYVTATNTQDTDIDGDTVVDTKYYNKAGNISDTVYGKFATASLNGDVLILTRNGVRGLQLYENITVESYRVQERSRNINTKLLSHTNLSDACAFVYQDKYYLSVNGVCYIADSRFTFQNEEDISSSFNYEWWFWANVDARVWAEIDNELYFGTSDGLICKFTEEYADVTFENSEAGDISVYAEANEIFFGALDDSLHEDDEIAFTQGDVYALHLDDDAITRVDGDGYYYFDEEILPKIYEGIKLYADRTNGTGLAADVEYTIDYVDLDNLRFTLSANGEQVISTSTGFRLCKKVSGKTLYVSNIDYDDKQFQVREFAGGEVLDLVIYNFSVASELLAIIRYKQNIRAEWYTPIYDLGTNMFNKTLLNVTIATEPLVKSSIQAGYQTRNLERDFTARGSGGFDFNDINFEDFSFESSFASSHTLRVKERNFNFIVLRYVSDNQNSCAVNSITIRYKINNINRGVR